MKTRREFLRQALLTSASAAWITACRNPAPADKTLPGTDALSGLREKFTGRILTSSDLAYDSARRVASWNSLTNKKPAIIAQCATADDVARSVEYARTYRLPVAARSGGHSFIGWSTCNDGMVIDFSPMKQIAIDPAKKIAVVGAGVRAEELVKAAASHGLVPVLGECGVVGVAGLTLGGGLGWLSGMHGAACDNLLAATLITTDSRRVTAGGGENDDLFWAIRGGGGNFGLATSLTFRLYPLTNVYAGGFTYSLDDAPRVLRFYRDFMATAPDDVQGLAFLYPSGKGFANVIFVCAGDRKAAEKMILPFSKIAKPLRDTFASRPYMETFTMPPYGEFAATEYGSTKGTYLATMSDAAIDLALDRFSKAPAGCAIGFDHYMHGKVCRVASDATAFSLRDPGGVHVWLGANWNHPADEESYTRWAADSWTSFRQHTGGRIYANYIGDDTGPSQDAIFGANVKRLAAIKKKFDPDNFLRLNQNITPA